jgi:hypothetical protein
LNLGFGALFGHERQFDLVHCIKALPEAVFKWNIGIGCAAD